MQAPRTASTGRRWTVRILVPALAVLAPVASAGAHHDPTAPVVVGTDPAGDWGVAGPVTGPAGQALGQDLVSATVSAPDEQTLRLTWGLAALPPEEEALRQASYVWDLRVDGRWWRLMTFLCDPTSDDPGSCQPEDGRGPAHFEVLRCGGPRLINIMANCQPVTSLPGAVDTAASTVAVDVPASLLEITTGSRITGINDQDDSVQATVMPNRAPLRDGLRVTAYTFPSFEHDDED